MTQDIQDDGATPAVDSPRRLTLCNWGNSSCNRCCSWFGSAERATCPAKHTRWEWSSADHTLKSRVCISSGLYGQCTLYSHTSCDTATCHV